MKKSRFSQRLTLALAATCGVLLLLVLLLEFGFGRGYRWWPPGTDEATPQQEPRARAAFKLPPWNEYAGIHTRPMFNEDRKPTPPAPPDAGPDKPIPRLNASLTGVILTPKVHVAMIVEQGKTQSTAVKEGGALPGDLNAWTLVKVKPRGAVFKSSAGEEAELELIAKGSGLRPPQPTPPAAQPPIIPQPQPNTAGTNQPPPAPAPAAAEQANELQARIDARRKQLQEQAERAKQQPQQENQ